MLNRIISDICRFLRSHPRTLVWIGMLLSAIFWTWPFFFHMGKYYKDLPAHDVGSFTWNLWWFKNCVIHLKNPFFSDMNYLPIGYNLANHTLSIWNCIIGLPFLFIFKPETVLNFLNFLSYPLTGWGTYLLARRMGISRGPAFLAGFMLMGHSYRFFNFQILNMMGTYVIPLWIVTWIDWLRKQTYKHVFIMALMTVITACTSWYYLEGVILVGIIILCKWLWDHRKESIPKSMVIQLGSAILLVIIIMSPYIWAIFYKSHYGISSKRDFLSSAALSADLLNYVFPEYLGDMVNVTGFNSSNCEKSLETHPGLSVYLWVILAMIWGKGARKKTYLWWILAFVFFIISLGPYLKCNGVIENNGNGIVMPAVWLKIVPFFNEIRAFRRFGYFVLLFFTIISGIGFSSSKIKQSRYLSVWLILLGILYILEFWEGPYKMVDAKASPIYYELAESEDHDLIMEIPFYFKKYPGKGRYLYYQTIHEHPIVNGDFSGDHNILYGIMRLDNLLIRYLMDIGIYKYGDFNKLQFFVDDFQKEQKNLRLRYIIIHRDLVDDFDWEFNVKFLTESVGYKVMAEDGPILALFYPGSFD